MSHQKTDERNPRTINVRVLKHLVENDAPDPRDDTLHTCTPRPAIAGECEYLTGKAEFCPWVGCRHHLYLDTVKNGSIKFNFGDAQPWEIPESCTLLMASFGPNKLVEIGEVMNITRERVRQIESMAVRRFKRNTLRMGVALPGSGVPGERSKPMVQQRQPTSDTPSAKAPVRVPNRGDVILSQARTMASEFDGASPDLPKGVRISPILATPAWATLVLEQYNHHNRAMNAFTVQRYVRAMFEDAFPFNGDTVRFDTEGILLDGQHRLRAIVESDKSQWLLVVTGLQRGAVLGTIDIGRKRSHSENLALDGERQTSLLASGLRWLLNLRSEKGWSMGRNSWEYRDLRDALREVPYIRDSVKVLGNMKMNKVAGTGGFFIALHAIWTGNGDKDIAESFLKHLRFGHDLPMDHVILQLRLRLLPDVRTGRRLPIIQRVALTIKAWKHFKRGTNPTDLRVRPGAHEKFPTIT